MQKVGIVREDSNEENNDNRNDKERYNRLKKYLDSVILMSESTAREYDKRLRGFDKFVLQKYGCNIDTVIESINEKKVDPYDVLSDYTAWLVKSRRFSSLSIKQRVVTAKNFFEYYDIEISPRKFKLKVKLPRSPRTEKEALTKEIIIDILNACSDMRVKTYLLLLASTGLRPIEAASVRWSDIDMESDPCRLFVRADTTKTKVSRTIFLTDEMIKQVKNWSEYKYRTRRVSYYDRAHKIITEYRTPLKNDNDQVFSLNMSKKHTCLSLQLRSISRWI